MVSEHDYQALVNGPFEHGKIMIDDWLELQSTERLTVARDRAMAAVGMDEIPDQDSPESKVLHEQFAEQLQMMAASDLLQGLEERGMIQVDGFTEDGEIQYVLTEDECT